MGKISSVEEANKFLLDKLHGCFETEDIVEGDKIILPEWNMVIKPGVSDIGENFAHTYYYITSPEWDRTLLECSSAAGSDSENAIGMAQASFTLGVMDSIRNMVEGQYGEKVETEFAGKTHSWTAYSGAIVGMGSIPDEVCINMYWEVLKEGILKRIGNQKLCYVKIYGANIGDGTYIGECRINDVEIPELSAMVETMIRKWDTEGYGSHKQFIMIKQDEETLIEYPFTSEEIADKVETAMLMFESCETDEEYEEFLENLEKVIGDKDLAWELYAFIPEICAEDAFPEIIDQNTISFYQEDGNVEYYRTQLASYHAIERAVFMTFDKGIFKDNQELYKSYISVSSIWSVICSARESGHDILKEGGKVFSVYAPGYDYIMR